MIFKPNNLIIKEVGIKIKTKTKPNIILLFIQPSILPKPIQNMKGYFNKEGLRKEIIKKNKPRKIGHILKSCLKTIGKIKQNKKGKQRLNV